MRRTSAAAVAATQLVAALLAAAAAPAARAAPAWLPAAALAPAGATAPAVALGPDGDVAVAWIRDGALETRVRPGRGEFGAVQGVVAGVSSAGVAMAADGTAILAWSQGDGVHASTRAPGAAFGPAQQIASVAGATGVRVAVNPRGDALVTFAADGAWAAHRPAGGAFETPAAPLPGSAGCDVRGAIGAGGHAAVGWRECGTAGTARVARRPPGGPFGEPADLELTTTLDLAVSADGTTAAVLQRAGAVLVAVAPPAGGYTTTALAPTGAAADGARVAAGGATLHAAWRSEGRIWLSRAAVNGTWSAGEPVSETGAGTPRLGAGADGGVAAAWLRAAGSGSVLEGASAPAAGQYAAARPVAVGGGAQALDFAVDSDGNGYAGFLADGVGGAALDTAGPRLLEFYARSAGFAGEPYGFGINPYDAWSAVAGSSFDFGDGTTAPGPGAVHTYRTPGERTVTAAAVDALGNVSVATRRFTVHPAPDRTAPVLTRLRMDARRFRLSPRPTPANVASGAAVRRGTRFRYTISEPGFGSIFIERIATGRRRGGRCVKGRGRGKRCRRYVPQGLITRAHPVAGAVSVGFSGRIVASHEGITVAEARLRPGRHRATVVVADKHRNASKPARIRFRVVR